MRSINKATEITRQEEKKRVRDKAKNNKEYTQRNIFDEEKTERNKVCTLFCVCLSLASPFETKKRRDAFWRDAAAFRV